LRVLNAQEEIMVNLMTEQEVSKRLNVSLASLRRWRLLRRGPAFVKVGSLVRYQPEDLDAWLASLPTGGSASHKRLPSGPLIGQVDCTK
jgi:excisionase family DNA binding protein